MNNIKNIEIAEYDYPLPDERIAKYPLAKRDSSKLLIYNKGAVSEDTFSALPQYVPSGALMIFNNTKVIQARLRFSKVTGAQIEIFCLEPEAPADYLQIFQQTESCVWQVLVGNSNRWKNGTLSQTVDVDQNLVKCVFSLSTDEGTRPRPVDSAMNVTELIRGRISLQT